MDTRTRTARRAAVASLVAGLGIMVGRLPAEEPASVTLTRLPARVFTGAAPATSPAPGLAPPAPAATMPELALPPSAPTTLPATPIKPPDDGLKVPAPAPAPAPAAGCDPCGDGKGGDGKGGAGSGDRFANVPPVQPFPRLGYFGIYPTGPGYYSLLDVLQGNYREQAPRHPHPRFGLFPWSFFDVDWRFLDDPNNTDTDYADCLKRQRFCDDLLLFTTGGELRGRYNYEANSRLLNEGRFAGRDNAFDLYRLRVYGDLMVTENFRLFAEFISAVSPNHLLPPQPVDRNPADFLNLFIDARVGTYDDKPIWFRLGRQELLYGSERLVSPLDWVNTRRTFQGGKLFWLREKDSVDLFLVQPVLPNDDKFDSVDNNVLFAGAWYTHRPKAGEVIDAYYLMQDDANRAFEGTGGQKGGRTVHTFGSRWTGDRDNWLWDVEAMLQCGEHVNQGLFANAYTAGGGYYFKDCDMTPIVWLYYDHASGTPNPGQGSLNQTFVQLYPFGHYYFGFIDIVGRRNINDVSAYLTLYPNKWIVTQFQCHNFWLDSPKDALYAANGQPIRQDKTGAAGNYVGTEFDFLINFHLDTHNDLFLSYSYMFAGPVIINTAKSQGGKQDPQALYVQYSYRW